jgi:hypothetical protein
MVRLRAWPQCHCYLKKLEEEGFVQKLMGR